LIHPLLGVRTDFSLGESILGIDDLPAVAEKACADVVGICDTMTISSVVEATKKLGKLDKRLLAGVRVRVIMEEDAGRDKSERETACFLKLYPTNDEGMRSLYRLLTRGFDADRFYFVPRVTWDDLASTLDDDCLVISTGDLESVAQRDDMLKALSDLAQRVRFVARFYELVPSDTPYFSRQNHRVIDWAKLNGCFSAMPEWEPLVVQPAFWLDHDDDAYSCNAGIADRRPYSDYLQPVPRYQPHTVKELAAATVRASNAVADRYGRNWGAEFKRGLMNTERLVELAEYKWAKLEPSLPSLADDPDEELKRLCKEGWSDRFTAPIFAHQPSPAELKAEYLPRLQFELDTLRRLGFAPYFLLVSDLVRWSKSKGIYVGPGRGSVGGSLVAYLVGITDVDPIRFKLLFERFINPDRLDLPDADLDFMSTRREEVIAYLADRYGAENVAGIVNYNTMGARGAIRDVARIYGLPQDQLGATKFIGDTHGVSAGLKDAFETTHEIQVFAEQFPHIWDRALKLEGKMRAYGTHAGGVVVAGEPLTKRAVVEKRGDARVINWDKRVSEEQGLIKLDVLGLSTLDMFDQALKLIFQRRNVRVDINKLPLDDEATLAIFSGAKTAGVFQFEGGSVRRLLKEMAKTASLSFEDLVALNALNRPGPLDAGITEAYIRRRAGTEAVSYPWPSLKPILEDTYGVIAYQEQVMQIARVLCGFTPGEADVLRKAMGKKDPVMMAQQRDKFVQGAVDTSGMPDTDADRLFTDIEGFAGYAFNRSHAVEYTLIAYQAAYLKAHYLVEFYTASMGIADSDKLASIVKQAAKDEIRVIPPDVNISTGQFEPLNDCIIIAPLSAVKNVSEKGASAIMAARSDPNPVVVESSTGRGKNKVTTTETFGPGRFVSMEDFKARVPSRAVNSKAIDHLDRVGAFARIVPGQAKSTDPSRQRDQIELMPAISDQGVVATRDIPVDDLVADTVVQVVEDMMANLGEAAVPCELGRAPKFMVILDAPFNDYEELKHQFSYVNYVAPSLHDAGMRLDDAVWTWVLRRPLKKGERDLPAKEVADSLPYLYREIAAMKPPVIVLLGPQAIKTFYPDLKGLADHVGRKTYSAELDATVIVGFKPTQIYHDASKRDALTKVFSEVRALVDNSC
jgi:DNA polymerase-3 subunit alpha